MVNAFVIGGNAAVKVMVATTGDGEKLMVFAPVAALAAVIAERKVTVPVAGAAVSRALLTVKVAGVQRSSSDSSRSLIPALLRASPGWVEAPSNRTNTLRDQNDKRMTDSLL